VKQPSTHASWVCAGTLLCTKTVAASRIDAQRQILSRGNQGAVPQRLGILGDGDGGSRDAEERFVLVRVVVLKRDPLGDGTSAFRGEANQKWAARRKKSGSIR